MLASLYTTTRSVPQIESPKKLGLRSKNKAKQPGYIYIFSSFIHLYLFILSAKKNYINFTIYWYLFHSLCFLPHSFWSWVHIDTLKVWTLDYNSIIHNYHSNTHTLAIHSWQIFNLIIFDPCKKRLTSTFFSC